MSAEVAAEVALSNHDARFDFDLGFWLIENRHQLTNASMFSLTSVMIRVATTFNFNGRRDDA
jgi:hypothetical protein